MGPSGASFPLCKKQKTVLSEAEVIGEQQLFEPFVPYGQPDGSKAGLKVPRDSITSSDYISQAIGDDASPIVIERSLKNRAIKDKSKADLESYVEKYHTRVSEYMNVDIEQLVLSMAEAILNPNADTTSDKVLEYAIDMEHAIDMAEVPALDKCNLFQVVGDMLKDAVMKLTITLKKLETKHAQWMASLTNEQTSSRARANQIRCLLESIKGEETGESNPQRYVIEQLQKEVAALKRKVGIQASHHVQTAELAQAEKEKADLADSLAKEKEEKKRMAETMAILQGRLMELQTIWDTHSCVPTSVLPETSSLSEQLITAKAAMLY